MRLNILKRGQVYLGLIDYYRLASPDAEKPQSKYYVVIQGNDGFQDYFYRAAVLINTRPPRYAQVESQLRVKEDTFVNSVKELSTGFIDCSYFIELQDTDISLSAKYVTELTPKALIQLDKCLHRGLGIKNHLPATHFLSTGSK